MKFGAGEEVDNDGIDVGYWEVTGIMKAGSVGGNLWESSWPIAL